MRKKRGETEDLDLGSRPGCFCKISNGEDKRKFKQRQSSYDMNCKQLEEQKAAATALTLAQQTKPTSSGESGPGCLDFFIFMIFTIIFVIAMIYISREKYSSSFPSSSEKSIFRAQLEASAIWRVRNRHYLGLWLGCYTNCEKSLSDYDNQTLEKVIKTVGAQFSEIILNPDESSSKVLSRFGAANLNRKVLQVHVTFEGLNDFYSVLDTVNKSRNQVEVKTLILKGDHSLYDSNLFGFPEVVLPTLITIRGKYVKNTQYKLGLLLDRNDCRKYGWELGEIVKKVDKIFYRTQRDYYKYQSPSHEGGRRVPDNQRQIKSADPVHYHLKMINDLEDCEGKLRGYKYGLEFIPVINCDKYWGQIYINLVTHEHKNLENLIKCWMLAGDWGERRGRNIFLLVDREIEKYDWFGQDLM